MHKFDSPNKESLEEKLKEHEDTIKQHKDLIEQHENFNAQEAQKVKVECGSHIKEFEEMVSPLLKEELLAELNELETEEKAENSKERESVKEALVPLVKKMHFLRNRTDITEEEYDRLHKKYKIISNAVGFINNEKVDHDR